ncbi:hypothetical protein A8D80_24410 [Burkholderia cenocepacia]|nr:hypothetical protein A8D80_24410 [Burkholderia cenocepacia]ONS26309.1 hypothetical protein A8E28_28740 [Burkholderia cenocepacia]ONV41095.1 hypothetical protein A8E82_16865 [Burkholderia cenocepacia]ONX53150.1 hypothetical protein A8F12_01425 [Burkholderia cenocepacia]ONY98556.1 hypothetical protein A8F31_11625 [Burkholderia cenocepacia]
MATRRTVRQGRIIRCLRADLHERRKNIWVNWTIRPAGADLAPDERLPCRNGAKLPGGAASCARRSKI